MSRGVEFAVDDREFPRRCRKLLDRDCLGSNHRVPIAAAPPIEENTHRIMRGFIMGVIVVAIIVCIAPAGA